MKKKKKFGQRLIDSLAEMCDAMKKGEPLEKRFRVTEVKKDSNGKITRTVKGPKKKNEQ